jgi:hypothetical protein
MGSYLGVIFSDLTLVLSTKLIRYDRQPNMAEARNADPTWAYSRPQYASPKMPLKAASAHIIC